MTKEIVNLSNYKLLGRRYEVSKKPFQVAFVLQPKSSLHKKGDALAVLELKPELKSLKLTYEGFCEKFDDISIHIEMTNEPFYDGIAKIPSIDEDVTIRFIWPMSRSFVERHGRQKQEMVESPHAYNKFSRFYIHFINRGLSNWLQNIIIGVSEQGNILYPKDGCKISPEKHQFILVRDPEWAQDRPETINFNAFFLDKAVRSVRDLSNKHVGLLKEIHDIGLQIIKKEVPQENHSSISMILHYHPTDFPLHIHFNVMESKKQNTDLVLSNVIRNLKSNSNYYKEREIDIFCRIPELTLSSTFFEYKYQFEYTWIARYLQLFIEATENEEIQKDSPNYDLIWKSQQLKSLFLLGRYRCLRHDKDCPFAKIQDVMVGMNNGKCICCGLSNCTKWHSNQQKLPTCPKKSREETPMSLHPLFCDWANLRYCGNHSKESIEAMKYIANVAQKFYVNQLDIFAQKFDRKISDSIFDQHNTSKSHDGNKIQGFKNAWVACSEDIQAIKEAVGSYEEFKTGLDKHYGDQEDIVGSEETLHRYLSFIP